MISVEQTISNIVDKLDNADFDYRILLKEIISSKKKVVKNFIPNTYIRNWFFADIRLALRKKNKSLVKMYLNHALSIIKTREIYNTIKLGKAKNLAMGADELKKGDVVLSYKTKRFLDKEFLSKLIAIAAYTQITHCSVVCEDENKNKRKLTSYAQSKGLAALDLVPQDGEVFFIFSPILPSEREKKLHDSIDGFYKKVLQKNNSRKIRRSLRFSEVKCWSACLSGFVFTSMMRFTGKYIVIPNPLYFFSGYYCSEIFDIMFRDIGIILSARAKNKALLGPNDMVYSPYLKFKGVIGEEKDIEMLNREDIII